MGADQRMFPCMWDDLHDLHRCEWIVHNGERTIRQVAESMVAKYGIVDGDTIVGASLGGMVACEISKFVNIKQLFLVGSAINSDEVNSLLNMIHPLAKYAPLDWIRVSSGKIPLDITQMFTGIEASFVRAMCDAIFEWEGLLDDTRVQVFRMHGKFDMIIPTPEHVDLLLNGGHLISITHEAECVNFIKAKLN